MKKEGVISMSTRELKRLHVIQQVTEKRFKQAKAAESLELSLRQIKRLVKRLREEGPRGIVHRLRGQPSNRKHPSALKDKTLRLCQTRYRGFGPTLAQEKLLERDKIRVNRETLRQWLLEAGLWEKTKKGLKHRSWRERKECFGEMIQMDGSHHDWLEGRGPEPVLMGLIDDATNHVFARFYDYEGTFPALDSFKRYTLRYGLPQSVYLDKHSTYQSQAKPRLEEELEGQRKAQSQFERALEELGVRVIHADSPQAKGRVERLFGIFQDRLIKEMRLENIRTKEEANRFLTRYLPRYNRRFQREPKSPANLHQPLPEDLKLKRIFSVQKRRLLRNDNTIRHNKKLYLIETPWNGRRPRRIQTEERLNGRLYLLDEDRELRYREIRERPLLPAPMKAPFPHKPPRIIPPSDHPWRKFRLPGSPSLSQDRLLTTNQKGDNSKLHKRGHF